MSLNPILLEMMAKERQRELLAMARPHVVPVPVGHRQLRKRKSFWVQARFGFARLLIHIGMRLKPGGEGVACPLGRSCGPLPAAGPLGGCDCPNREDARACPPLHSG